MGQKQEITSVKIKRILPTQSASGTQIHQTFGLRTFTTCAVSQTFMDICIPTKVLSNISIIDHEHGESLQVKRFGRVFYELFWRRTSSFCSQVDVHWTQTPMRLSLISHNWLLATLQTALARQTFSIPTYWTVCKSSSCCHQTKQQHLMSLSTLIYITVEVILTRYSEYCPWLLIFSISLEVALWLTLPHNKPNNLLTMPCTMHGWRRASL